MEVFYSRGCIELLRSGRGGSRQRRISAILCFLVTTVELTHGMYSLCTCSGISACLSRSSFSW